MTAIREFLSGLRHNQIIEVDGRDFITYNHNGVREWSTLGGAPHGIFQMAVKIEDYYNKLSEVQQNGTQHGRNWR
jgi:hypothetical protein